MSDDDDGPQRYDRRDAPRGTGSAAGTVRWPGKTTLVDQERRKQNPAPAVPGKRTVTQSVVFPAMPSSAAKDHKLFDVYFDIYRRDLIDAVKAQLAQAFWPDPAEDLPFARGGERAFVAYVERSFHGKIAGWEGHQLFPLVFPGDPEEALRRFVGTDKEHLEHANWSPAFGDAFAHLVEAAVRASLEKRMGPRYRAAAGQMMEAPQAEDLIAGHPIDPIVAAALTQPGILDRSNVAVEKDVGPPKLQHVTARWLGREDPGLWNFVVIEPASATVEDVAAALWRNPAKTTNAYALTKVGDIVRVAPGHARPLLRQSYPGEVIGSADSDASKAQQLYALSLSRAGAQGRDRMAAAAEREQAKEKAPPTKGGAKQAGHKPGESAAAAETKPPTLAEVVQVEDAIGLEIESLRTQLAPFGLADPLQATLERRAPRAMALASGDPKTVEHWVPVLQFQHTQLLTIVPRIAPLVEKLLPVAFIPSQYLDEAARMQRDSARARLTAYVGAAATSDDRAVSTQLLAAIVAKEKAEYVGALNDAQINLRDATRQGITSKVGAAKGSVEADEELSRQREAAMSGKQTGRSQYDQKKALIRAGEAALRSRMNSVEQSLVQLREAAAEAGFADPATLRKLIPNAKTLPEVLADVHDHLRDVDHTWDRTRSEFSPDVLPSDAPEDWDEWQERDAGLEAARGAFAKIAGDEDISTFFREAQAKIQNQRMWSAVTKVASALLLTLATGMGAAMIGEAIEGALIVEGATWVTKAAAIGMSVTVNASINTMVQLAISDSNQSFGWAFLENALMEMFTRGLMKPLKDAERAAQAEVQEIVRLPGLSEADRAAVAASSSFAGVHLIAEGVGGMATQWAAHRLVEAVRGSGDEVSEPFALTVLQQGAALALGRFFSARIAAWQKHRAKLEASRFAELPEMRALFAERETFYADADALARQVSPQPGAGDTLAARDAVLLKKERVILGKPGGSDPAHAQTKSTVEPQSKPREVSRVHEETARPVDPREQPAAKREPAEPSHVETGSPEDRIILSGDDGRMHEAAKRVKPEPGYVDVIVHGDADGFWVIRTNQDIRLDHRSLATYLRKQGLAGKKIRLIACESGLTPFAVAQHLSNKLGVEVIAPNGIAWINRNGELGVGPINEHRGGFKEFEPRISSADGSKPMQVPEQPHVEPAPGAREVVEPLAVHFDRRERYGASNHDELQAKLGKELVPDEALGDGVKVEVKRRKGWFGHEWIVERVRVGPEARAEDVLAHAELIKLVEKYNGLIGSIRRWVDRIRGRCYEARLMMGGTTS